MIPNMTQAMEILQEYNQNPALITHAKTVSGVMRHFAGRFGGDPEIWAAAGLLHDVDYEKWPEEHCVKALELFRNHGVDDDFARQLAAHGWDICIDIAPETDMAKVLYTIDELTGLITAAAIMRPSKSVMDLELKSVKKKYKTKSFAAGVDRAIIEKGCDMIGMTLDEVITECIMGMRECADEIGLRGEE